MTADTHSALRETAYLDYHHPALQTLIRRAEHASDVPRERAVVLHDLVRDQIEFGFDRHFYARTASEVLTARRGFCNTQATVLTALLRGAGIPARIRVYALSAEVLQGVIDPCTRWIDHAVVEACIEGRWVRTDSYLFDAALQAAVAERDGATVGFGVRRDAVSQWNGRDDAFAQFHPDHVGRDFGVFDDIGAFYREASQPNNRMGPISHLFFRRAARRANERLATLRAGNAGRPATSAA